MYSYKSTFKILTTILAKETRACSGEKIIGFEPMETMDGQVYKSTLIFQNAESDEVTARCLFYVHGNSDIDIDVEIEICDTDSNEVKAEVDVVMFVHNNETLAKYTCIDKMSGERRRERVVQDIENDKKVKLINAIINNLDGKRLIYQ